MQLLKLWLMSCLYCWADELKTANMSYSACFSLLLHSQELRQRGVAPDDIAHLLESRPTSSTAAASPSHQYSSPTSIPDTQPTPSSQPPPDAHQIPDSQVSLVGTEAKVTHHIEFRMRRTLTRQAGLEDCFNGFLPLMDNDD